MERKMTCTICPRGCELSIKTDDGREPEITGNACPRGIDYALAELTNPVRTLTTTVALTDGRLISVKSDRPLPKARLMDCMKEIYPLVLDRNPGLGGIVLENILGLGVNIVSTSASEGEN